MELTVTRMSIFSITGGSVWIRVGDCHLISACFACPSVTWNETDALGRPYQLSRATKGWLKANKSFSPTSHYSRCSNTKGTEWVRKNIEEPELMHVIDNAQPPCFRTSHFGGDNWYACSRNGNGSLHLIYPFHKMISGPDSLTSCSF